MERHHSTPSYAKGIPQSEGRPSAYQDNHRGERHGADESGSWSFQRNAYDPSTGKSDSGLGDHGPMPEVDSRSNDPWILSVMPLIRFGE
ncbi:hypothetical protein An16g02830 [Aspergillus niger]|uniref:Uncharacterized protein n=2 Tax=Aspergillus niger TaxID=5061 RepID=A2R7A4_ASPNC|nr:hypothetical protein An16g02830 [Aspergillus niger]CAK48593.1 hypothetical protein An16g02830 [Aspergillus niger]